MILTLKILIAITLLFYLVMSWMNAVAIAAAGIMVDRNVSVGPVTRKKVNDLTGRSALKAIGATLWLAPLAVLTWIYL